MLSAPRTRDRARTGTDPGQSDTTSTASARTSTRTAWSWAEVHGRRAGQLGDDHLPVVEAALHPGERAEERHGHHARVGVGVRGGRDVDGLRPDQGLPGALLAASRRAAGPGGRAPTRRLRTRRRAAGWSGRRTRRRTGSPGGRRARRRRRSARAGPAFITPTRSAMASASSWSWVTNRVVVPTSSWTRRISSRSCTRTFASRADSGSSSSSTDGSTARARASATRCCWPPESWWA